MKQEIKELWINALLSGEYQQGTGLLCNAETNGEKFWCCLGVLTDLAIKNGVDLDISMGHDMRHPNAIYFNGEAEKLPVKVQEWSGLNSLLGHYSYEDINDFDYEEPETVAMLETTLAEDNDEGASFEELARTIESYF